MNVKEVREWTTCIASVVVPGLLVWGSTVLKSQRLEMEAEMAKIYLPKTEFSTEKDKLEKSNDETFKHLSDTNSKLEEIKVSMAETKQVLADLKEELKIPARRP